MESAEPNPPYAANAAPPGRTPRARAWAWARQVSLRHWLTLPFVTLVMAVALTIGLLSYTTGRDAVDTLSDQLLLETVDRIGQAVDRHVIGSAAALEAAFPEGLAAPATIEADLPGLRNRFWIATSLHLDPNNYVYYGNRQGQFFGLWRYSQSEAELRLKFRADEHRSLQRFFGLNGVPAAPSIEPSVYDPRVRPWYRAGQASAAHTWTSIYIDYRTTDLVATRAHRVLDAQGELAGVVATDMSLRALNDFVRRLRLSEHGRAFIIEQDGSLIASSRSDNVRRTSDGVNTRLKVTDSSDAIERAAFAEVRRAMAASKATTGSFGFTGPDGRTEQLAYARLRDSAGLDWIVVVAVPRSDFMAGITANVARTVAIAAAAALAALLLGLGIVRWISGDLARLAQAARAIGEGHLDVPLAIDRRDELGVLAEGFRQMQQRLRTDALTGLINRDTMVRRIDERILRHRRATDEQPFAVLFVDVNDFKQVNDTLGHEAGDAVLVEIGQRLRAGMRSGDLVARFAGDEFIVLLDAVDSLAVAQHMREQIERALRLPVTLPAAQAVAGRARDVATSVSIGVALYYGSDSNAEDLIRRADADMYQRKAIGKAANPPR